MLKSIYLILLIRHFNLLMIIIMYLFITFSFQNPKSHLLIHQLYFNFHLFIFLNF